MKRYTIGIMFKDECQGVLLIHKLKPNWQQGKLNLPGGKLEDGEIAEECIAREFKEETGLITSVPDWMHIGNMTCEGNWKVDILICVYKPEFGQAESLTDELVSWCRVDCLPKHCLSNLHWLIPFAYNCINKGNQELELASGHFNYDNECSN